MHARRRGRNVLACALAACSASAANWGVVYGALGRTSVERALLSAQALRTQNVSIFTLDYDDGLALCEEEAAGPGWTCVDLAQQIARPRLPELTASTWRRVVRALRCLLRRAAHDDDDVVDNAEEDCPRSDDGNKTDALRFATRVGKVLSLLLSPYDVSMFLDAETLPCASIFPTLLRGDDRRPEPTEVFDVLGAMNHVASLRTSDPPAAVSGGVLVVANRRPAVRAFLAGWLHRIDKYDSARRMLDQPPLREALFDALARRALTFSSTWNFTSWAHDVGIGCHSKVLPSDRVKGRAVVSTGDDDEEDDDASRAVAGRHLRVLAAEERLPAEEEKTRWAAVEREMDRSLREFPVTLGFAEFFKCAHNLVLVVNGRLFVTDKFHMLGAHKERDHLTFALSIDLPRNSLYVVDLGARGSAADARRECRAPVFVIAKKTGYRQNAGVLIPNPYFGNVSHWETRRPVQQTPWALRKPQAVWRGGVACLSDCGAEEGNWKRFAAVAAAWKRPDVLDFKFINDGGKVRNLPCPDLPSYTNDMRAALAVLRRSNGSDFLVGDFLEVRNFSEYQFAVSLPGVMGGSYSRHLNNLWDLGLVVLLWRNSHVEWYYPALKANGVTHLAVDETTVADTVERLRGRVDETAELRRNAAQVYEQFLSKRGLTRYF